MPTLHDKTIDAALTYLRDNGTTMRLLSSKPADLGQASSATLGSVSVSDVDYGAITGSNQFWQIDGPTAEVSISNGGTARYVSLDDGTALLHVGEIAPTTVEQGTTREVTYGTVRINREGYTF